MPTCRGFGEVRGEMRRTARKLEGAQGWRRVDLRFVGGRPPVCLELRRGYGDEGCRWVREYSRKVQGVGRGWKSSPSQQGQRRGWWLDELLEESGLSHLGFEGEGGWGE